MKKNQYSSTIISAILSLDLALFLVVQLDSEPKDFISLRPLGRKVYYIILIC